MTHDEDVVVVNTNESLVRLFKQSASHAWSVDPERVKQTKLLVCVHNTPHLPLHNTVFAIGKVLPDGVMPVEGEPDRTIIGVSAFALVDNVYCRSSGTWEDESCVMFRAPNSQSGASMSMPWSGGSAHERAHHHRYRRTRRAHHG